jgi:LytR cell envelope-related transcriptional attenuator
LDVPIASPQELVRPWRRATLLATALAAVELVLLVVAGTALLAKPLARAVRSHAEATAFAPPKQVHAKPARAKTIAVGLPRLARQETGVFVLNGNGRSGAAAAAASKLHGLGYVVSGTGNAPRADYATTVIMFRRGFKPEGLRLARDLHAKAVGPLDGMSIGELRGAHLAIVLGAG